MFCFAPSNITSRAVSCGVEPTHFQLLRLRYRLRPYKIDSDSDYDSDQFLCCYGPQSLRFSDVVVCLNPRPAGPLDFPPPAGGGGRLNAPPMISAPGRRREKRKAAFESSRKIISKSFRSFFGSGQNWGLQGSKFQNFPKRFFDNKNFNFKDRATNLIPLCLSR